MARRCAQSCFVATYAQSTVPYVSLDVPRSVTLAYNGTFYTMSAFNPVAANDLIELNKINYLFSVPTLYQAIVSASNYKPEKMASLDLVLYGGAPIMPALLYRIDREWPAAVRLVALAS